ncbi:hypothetical protein M8J77_004804 [Diaphorina citri]|nr:hypothetical protein M8J77_004804 [Diaphorina citri]
MWKGEKTNSMGDIKSKFKKNRAPKITFDTIERELGQLAKCFEEKRQKRLAKIEEELQECIVVKRCCIPRPTSADFLFDKFLVDLEEDRKLRKKIALYSSCSKKMRSKKKPKEQETESCKCAEIDLHMSDNDTKPEAERCSVDPWEEILKTICNEGNQRNGNCNQETNKRSNSAEIKDLYTSDDDTKPEAERCSVDPWEEILKTFCNEGNQRNGNCNQKTNKRSTPNLKKYDIDWIYKSNSQPREKSKKQCKRKKPSNHSKPQSKKKSLTYVGKNCNPESKHRCACQMKRQNSLKSQPEENCKGDDKYNIYLQEVEESQTQSNHKKPEHNMMKDCSAVTYYCLVCKNGKFNRRS